MDAGIAIHENLEYLYKKEFHYIVVGRTKCLAVPERKPDDEFETMNNVKIRAWKLNPIAPNSTNASKK